MKLSLCIATFNEESNIHYPLDSAYDLVEEVVIVDGGSTDKTVEIAKSYGKKVRLISAPNPAMFHINKQKAIEAAKGEWILQLDADESISDELKLEIKRIINNSEFRVQNSESKSQKEKIPDSKFVAYWLPRKNWFLTRFLMKGGQYPDYTIRLYRKGTVRFPLKSVHENVELNSEYRVQNSEFIGFLKNPILHYADPDFSRYLKRWDRYTTLDAELLSKKLQPTNYNLQTVWMFFNYFVLKPKLTFFLMYFRHLGILDGFAGFVFALFSSIRFWVIFIKWFQISQITEDRNQKPRKSEISE